MVNKSIISLFQNDVNIHITCTTYHCPVTLPQSLDLAGSNMIMHLGQNLLNVCQTIVNVVILAYFGLWDKWVRQRNSCLGSPVQVILVDKVNGLDYSNILRG